ncbi:MAG: metal-sensing transcriptional repressor, partial [Polyangiaceae bacterium]
LPRTMSESISRSSSREKRGQGTDARRQAARPTKKQTTRSASTPRQRGEEAPAQTDRRADDILARLRSVEGHLRGIAQMVEADAHCVDVLRQTRAVRAALSRVDAALLERHLGDALSRSSRATDAAERERIITELVDVYTATR